MTLPQRVRTDRSLHPVESVDRPIQTLSKPCMKFSNAGLAAFSFSDRRIGWPKQPDRLIFWLFRLALR